MQWRRTMAAACATAMLFGMACASSGASAGGSSSSSRDVLTRAEMDESQSGTVSAAIRRHRPSWLTPHGGGGRVQIMLNGAPNGDLGMATDNVIEIRYLNPSDATTLWGTGYAAGAIDIITR